MEYTKHLAPLWVPDYSNFHGRCDNCDRILSQVRETQPRPCYLCYGAHYCSPRCLLIQFRTTHRAQCMATLDAEVDMRSAETLTASQALWDLRKYTARWHDQLGDAAVAAMNLHADPTAMDKQALVVHLTYVPRQPYRMRRFRLQYARVEPLVALAGSSMNAALIRREENSIVNQRNGMVGCVLIVLACDVPGIGFVFNSTFIGPEQSLLIDPPLTDWQEKLWAAVRINERP